MSSGSLCRPKHIRIVYWICILQFCLCLIHLFLGTLGVISHFWKRIVAEIECISFEFIETVIFVLYEGAISILLQLTIKLMHQSFLLHINIYGQKLARITIPPTFRLTVLFILCLCKIELQVEIRWNNMARKFPVGRLIQSLLIHTRRMASLN